MPIVAHPSLGGVLRARESVLFGKLFRWYGADAVIFPHAGGRFSYSAETCRESGGSAAGAALASEAGIPHARWRIAGRTGGGLAEFYGRDCILLIGSGLYEAGDGLLERTRGAGRAGGPGSEELVA